VIPGSSVNVGNSVANMYRFDPPSHQFDFMESVKFTTQVNNNPEFVKKWRETQSHSFRQFDDWYFDVHGYHTDPLNPGNFPTGEFFVDNFKKGFEVFEGLGWTYLCMYGLSIARSNGIYYSNGIDEYPLEWFNITRKHGIDWRDAYMMIRALERNPTMTADKIFSVFCDMCEKFERYGRAEFMPKIDTLRSNYPIEVITASWEHPDISNDILLSMLV